MGIGSSATGKGSGLNLAEQFLHVDEQDLRCKLPIKNIDPIEFHYNSTFSCVTWHFLNNKRSRLIVLLPKNLGQQNHGPTHSRTASTTRQQPE